MANFVIFIAGSILLLPAAVLLFSGNTYYFLFGMFYVTAMIFSGTGNNRKFWRRYFAVIKKLFPLPKEYDN